MIGLNYEKELAAISTKNLVVHITDRRQVLAMFSLRCLAMKGLEQ